MDDRRRARLDAEMTRLADGQRDAFDFVFETLWPVVRAFATRALGSPEDGEDAAQTTMEKLFSRASDYEPGRPALTWALALAAWEVRTVRTRRRRSRVDVGDVERAVADGPSSEEALARRELEAALAEALLGLADEDRATLTDAFHAELGAPRTPAERKRKERALDRLRALFFGGPRGL